MKPPPSKKLKSPPLPLEDRLTNLPTNLLHRIFSYLPSKTTAQTSILSKRWQSLWTSTPTLHFNQSLFPYPHKSANRDYFMHFVDQFLLHRDGSTVHSLLLHCGKSCTTTRVKPWISYAINHNVQSVDVRLIGEPHLPRALFTSHSLQELKLNLSGFSLNLPKSGTNLPNLKTLELSYVCFGDKKLATKFFSNCPVLENLTLRDCEFGRIFYLNGSKLKNLSVLYLRREPEKVCKFMISAALLKSFKFKGYFGWECILENALDICDVDLDLWSCQDVLALVNGSIYARFMKLITGLCNAQVLSMSLRTFQIFSAEGQNLEIQLSPFSGLKSLKVMTGDRQAVLPFNVLSQLLKCSSSASISVQFVEETGSQDKLTNTECLYMIDEHHTMDRE